MKAEYEKIIPVVYFAFGMLAGVAANFFMREHTLLGTAVVVATASLAAYYSRNDLREEVALLRNAPANLVHAIASYRDALEIYMSKALREMRQKRLLRRNRTYRLRKLLSA